MDKTQFVKEALKDFQKTGTLPSDFIDSFREMLPEEMIYVWEEYGLGFFGNGYFRVIDPRAFADPLEEIFFAGKECVPLMVTALGDVLVWDDDAVCYELIFCRYGIYKLFEEDIFRQLLDKEFVNNFFELVNYAEAVKLYGVPDFDECFGYVPLLALGGGETADHLKRCKVREHIYLISQMAGQIGE